MPILPSSVEVARSTPKLVSATRIGDAGGRHGHAAPQNPWKLPGLSLAPRGFPAFAEWVLLRA